MLELQITDLDSLLFDVGGETFSISLHSLVLILDFSELSVEVLDEGLTLVAL